MQISVVVIGLVICWTTTIFQFVDARSGLECDPTAFTSPYVIVRRRKNGENIDSLRSTGFVDLSSQFNIIVCINGPAVVLNKYEEIENGTDITVSVFSSIHNPRLRIYAHHCLKVNRVTEDEIFRLQAEHIPLKVTDAVKVVNKMAGVHLVGEEGDYRNLTSAIFFHEQQGNNIHPQNIVTDGSFAMIQNTATLCYNVNDEFKVKLTSKAKTPEEVCVWTLNYKAPYFERYEAIFRSGRTRDQYSSDKHCDDGGGGTTTPIPSSTSSTTLDPFSIIDISGGGHHGGGGKRRRNKTGPPKPQIMLEYRVEFEEQDCQPFPAFDDTGCVNRSSSGDRICDLLDQAVPIPPVKDLAEDPELGWKNEILDIVSEIFGSICEAFPLSMPYSVHRVLEFYLDLAHKANTGLRKNRLAIWDHLLSDLKRCKANANFPILFEWKTQGSTDTSEMPQFSRRARMPNNHNKRLNATTFTRSRKVSHKEEDEKDYDIVYEDESSEEEEEEYEVTSVHMPTYKPPVPPPPRPIEDLDETSQEVEDSETTNRKKGRTVTASTDPTPSINREYIQPPIAGRHKAATFMEYPIDVHHMTRDKKILTKLFYYEDDAEIEYELNIAIDIAWKIVTTVGGYCNQHYAAREAEVFPRFSNQYFEDFLQPVMEDWLANDDNEILRVLFSDYNSDTGMRWLDTCLEGSFVDSKVPSYRPPRPLLVKGNTTASLQKAASFLDTPTWLVSSSLVDGKLLPFKNNVPEETDETKDTEGDR